MALRELLYMGAGRGQERHSKLGEVTGPGLNLQTPSVTRLEVTAGNSKSVLPRTRAAAAASRGSLGAFSSHASLADIFCTCASEHTLCPVLTTKDLC